MKSKPMLFSAPMVRALLEGRKTQTRRKIKKAVGLSLSVDFEDGEALCSWLYGDGPGYDVHERTLSIPCPHPVGSEIWVRESGWERPDRTKRDLREGADTWPPYEYTADLSEAEIEDLKAWGWKRRNSIFMPRWASRITLKVTDVRVQRLQDISKEDAKAEGIRDDGAAYLDYMSGDYHFSWAVSSYQSLWESINGPGSWEANPYVWAYTFEVKK